ncbi:MAG: hypothetical protein JST28_01270 [Acidobacteria bacterium]|nr:hypothetical protein [Acidobacteriota bacterium]
MNKNACFLQFGFEYTTASATAKIKNLHSLAIHKVFNAAHMGFFADRWYDPPKDTKQSMTQNDYYALAHEQASKERADIRTQIDTLLARDARLEKLVDVLKDILPQQSAVEAHADNHHEHNGSHEHHG